MKKGISLVSLVVVIIILAILAGIVVIEGIDSAETATANQFAIEMLNIQTAVDEYYYRYNKYPVTTEVTFGIGNKNLNSLNQFESEDLAHNQITLKLLDLSLLGMNGLEFGNNSKEKDVYALSETTGKVYYLSGIEYDGVMYYTLTNDLYEEFNITSNRKVNATDIKKHDVIFTVSNMGYTNTPVVVDIKIPKEANFDLVNVTNSKSVSEQEIVDEYKVIKVNQTGDNRNGNYEVTVKYTYNQVQKTVNYAVTSFDNTAPTINITETKQGSIKIVKVQTSDSESGIKMIKYAESEINDATYFKEFGKVLRGTELRMDESINYTLYVEDKAENFSTLNAKAYAIYSATDNSLTFVRTGREIVKQDTYNDKEITEVYTGFETAVYTEETEVPWYVYKERITSVTVEDKISPASTQRWFQGFVNCSNLDLQKLDTSKVVDASYMFSYTGNSTSVTEFKIKGANNWDTSNITNMEYMFYATGANATWSLNCSKWLVTKVKSYTNFNFGVESKVIAPSFGA